MRSCVSFARRFVLNAAFSLCNKFDRQTKRTKKKWERKSVKLRAKRTGGKEGHICVDGGLTGSRLTEQDQMDRNVKKKKERYAYYH